MSRNRPPFASLGVDDCEQLHICAGGRAAQLIAIFPHADRETLQNLMAALGEDVPPVLLEAMKLVHAAWDELTEAAVDARDIWEEAFKTFAFDNDPKFNGAVVN